MDKSNHNFNAIIGIGNPTKKYQNTYHNVGILTVKYFSKTLGYKKSDFSQPGNKKFEYIKTNNIILSNSISFMNTSGDAVQSFMQYFKIDIKNILIVQDDSDLCIGKYKIDFEKNSAGHNGIKDIIEKMESKSFWRLRIGIREKMRHHQKSEDFVLKKINKANMDILENVFNEVYNKIINHK